MAIIVVVLLSAILIALVALGLYLIGGGSSRRAHWESQARIIFWDLEAPEGVRKDQ